jgi:hypothetical protein
VEVNGSGKHSTYHNPAKVTAIKSFVAESLGAMKPHGTFYSSEQLYDNDFRSIIDIDFYAHFCSFTR